MRTRVPRVKRADPSPRYLKEGKISNKVIFCKAIKVVLQENYSYA